MYTKIKIGDTVKIINWGQVYSTFNQAAKDMGLTKFVSGYEKRSHKDTIYKVINICSRGSTLLGITDGIVELIIGEIGVEFIEPPPPIPEKAKVPQFFNINNLYPYTD